MNRVDAIPAIALVMKAVLQRPLFLCLRSEKKVMKKVIHIRKMLHIRQF